MEGLNLAAILLGELAVLAFGITSLVAFGLLITRHTSAARILFAVGFWCAANIAALALLSFLAPESRHDIPDTLVVLTAMSLFLAGAGQLVASLRSTWDYAAAFGCAAVSLVLMASPLVLLSPLPAVAGVAIAVFLPFRSRQMEVLRRRQEAVAGVLAGGHAPAHGLGPRADAAAEHHVSSCAGGAMAKCPICSADMDSTELICPRCGLDVTPSEPPLASTDIKPGDSLAW